MRKDVLELHPISFSVLLLQLPVARLVLVIACSQIVGSRPEKHNSLALPPAWDGGTPRTRESLLETVVGLSSKDRGPPLIGTWHIADKLHCSCMA